MDTSGSTSLNQKGGWGGAMGFDKHREPKKCEKCGEPLGVYMQVGGVSERWYLTAAAMTSAVSNLCGKCYRESLEEKSKKMLKG